MSHPKQCSNAHIEHDNPPLASLSHSPELPTTEVRLPVSSNYVGFHKGLRLWALDSTVTHTHKPHFGHGGVAISWEACPPLPLTRSDLMWDNDYASRPAKPMPRAATLPLACVEKTMQQSRGGGVDQLSYSLGKLTMMMSKHKLEHAQLKCQDTHTSDCLIMQIKA